MADNRDDSIQLFETRCSWLHFIDIRPDWDLRNILLSLIRSAALIDPRYGGGGSGSFHLALVSGRRAKSVAGRQRRKKPASGARCGLFKLLPVWARPIPQEETLAKFAGLNWELLSYAGEDRQRVEVVEWHRVTWQRIDDIRDAWRWSLDEVNRWGAENPEVADRLDQAGRDLCDRLPDAEAAEVAACRRLLDEKPLPGGFRLQGSLAELWSFQAGSDLDIVRCWPRDKSLHVVNLSPGLCQLRRLATVERVGLRAGLVGLFARHLRFASDGAVTQMLSPARFRRRMAGWRLADSRRRGLGGCLRERGPAVTQDSVEDESGSGRSGCGDNVAGDAEASNSQQLRQQLPSLDFVCSVRLTKWPRFLTKEWLPRHCRRHLFSASQARVHVVPIGRPGGTRRANCTHAWRYSYHELEAAIARSLGPVEGACYGLMKAAHSRYLKQAGYKSYHVKTAFLWLRHLEEPDTWKLRPDRLLRLALAGLSLTMRCASKGFMPNYFMPNENIMRQSLPRAEPVSLPELASFLADAAARPVTAVDRGRLAVWLDSLASDINASAGDLAEAAAADCYCRVNALTGASLESDCADCDRLIEWDCATQSPRRNENVGCSGRAATDLLSLSLFGGAGGSGLLSRANIF